MTETVEQLSAHEVVTLALERHHPQVVLACSFQKEESVLIDMLMEVEPSARVFTLDTGVLFPETYAAWRDLEQRFGFTTEVHDAASPGRPWTGPPHCCGASKVAALDRALAGVDAWITGLRREQAPTRAGAQKLEWDQKRAIWKYNPLADWSEGEVWRRLRERKLPYHPLHDRGYDSIGCAPCTAPGAGRDGRWPGQSRTECGMHRG